MRHFLKIITCYLKIIRTFLNIFDLLSQNNAKLNILTYNLKIMT